MSTIIEQLLADPDIDPETGEPYHQDDPELDALYDARLLEYPTITRAPGGDWRFFDVQWEGDDREAVVERGRQLARRTLELAGRTQEPCLDRMADEMALRLTLEAALNARGYHPKGAAAQLEAIQQGVRAAMARPGRFDPSWSAMRSVHLARELQEAQARLSRLDAELRG